MTLKELYDEAERVNPEALNYELIVPFNYGLESVDLLLRDKNKDVVLSDLGRKIYLSFRL